MAITKVWIEEGCTLCGLCEEECEAVFELDDDTAVVKENAVLAGNEEDIVNAAESCPVEIILYEED